MEEPIFFSNSEKLNPIITQSKKFKENESVSKQISENYYFDNFDDLFKKDFLKKYFEDILNKLKYWGINPLPYDVVNFFVKNKENIVNLDGELLKYFAEINAIVQSVIKKENMCNNAVKINSVNLLKAAIENGYEVIKNTYIDTFGSKTHENYIIKNDTFFCAIQHGSLSCIQYLNEIHKIDLDYYYDDFEHYEYIYNIAASKGYLDIICYLHKIAFGIKFARQTFNEDEIADGALWGGNTVCAAAGNGHKHILEYFRDNSSYRDPYPTYHAALNGQKECLLYLNENDFRWDSTTPSHAARNGHLDILKLLFERGCLWTKHTCEEATRNGHQDCLIYAHQNGCPIDRTTVLVAVMNGHLECMQYIVEHITEEWKAESITKFAVQYGHLNCFKYAIEQGCPFNKDECLRVAKGECKQYILENLSL